MGAWREFWEHNLVAPVPGLPTTASNFGYATAITFVLYPTVPYPRYLTQGTTAERVECSNSRNRARSPRYRKQARYFAGTARSTAQAGAYEGMHQHCAKYSYDTDEAPAGKKQPRTLVHQSNGQGGVDTNMTRCMEFHPGICLILFTTIIFSAATWYVRKSFANSTYLRCKLLPPITYYRTTLHTG
ncbi:hypothetical protein MCOR02_002484 [Pyricularia oryzae]|nr:hypothetical protein MCOR02_002484 [Pyricularia oryzae]